MQNWKGECFNSFLCHFYMNKDRNWSQMKNLFKSSAAKFSLSHHENENTKVIFPMTSFWQWKIRMNRLNSVLTQLKMSTSMPVPFFLINSQSSNAAFEQTAYLGKMEMSKSAPVDLHFTFIVWKLYYERGLFLWFDFWRVYVNGLLSWESI